MRQSRRSVESVGHLRLTLVAVMIMGVTTGCGGSDDAPLPPVSEPRNPAVWAADFCEGMNNYVDEISIAVRDRDSASAVTAEEDLAAHQANLTAYFERWRTATDALLDHLESIGYPDLPGGETAAQNYRDELGRASPAAREALTAVAALPLDDPSAFWAQLENLENAFGEAAHLDPVTIPAGLQEFMDAEPTCEDRGPSN